MKARCASRSGIAKPGKPLAARSAWAASLALAVSFGIAPSWATAQTGPEGRGTNDSPADGAPSGTTAAPPTLEVAPSPARQAAVVDAITYGIAPVVGRVASDQLRRTAAEMGYSVLPPGDTVRAFQQLRLPYPPAPADLWRLGWATRSHRTIFARAWANEGRYVVEVIVASLDGSGPFVVTETSGADDLRDAVDRALRNALPPPAVWTGPEPAFSPVGTPWGAGIAPRPPPPTTMPTQARPRSVREELGHPTARDGRRWRPSEPDIRRLSVALQTEASLGTTQDGFYNHFVGLRLDVRITREILVGLYGAYVNLDGRDGRAHNFLLMLQAEDRIRPSSTLELTIPLRIGIGYLPFNGPVFRLAAGLNYALSPHWEIGADLVAPTFYVLPNRFGVAFDFSLEIAYRF